MPKRDMLINYVPGEECRIAILEDGRLEEIYQERASEASHVGNIYKGKVTNVESGIQAAFIDFGLERHGFLHITDLHPKYFPGKSKEETERVGLKTPRRSRPPIQKCLKRGDEVLVQVIKEGIGTKGPTLTSYLSIPGRFIVMMPDMEKMGVSRKSEDDEARRAAREQLRELDPPKEFGFIVRTAGIGRTKTELKRDLAYLQRLWKAMETRRKKLKRPGELYAESDLQIRTLRDVYSTDIDRVIVDNAEAARRAADFLAVASPRTGAKSVYHYDEPTPIFNRFGVEQQIESTHHREVPLKSGGSLVIDSTEALVAIDVNSGKMRDKSDAEQTAFKTNIEATDEICRQLRLRDLGGVVVCDLIDMRFAKHRREIEQRFRDNLKNDRARTKTLAISQFGILEMTRQRMRPSLKKSVYKECPSCKGDGFVKTNESVVLDVMRRLSLVAHRKDVTRIELAVSADIASVLLNRRRTQLVQIERRYETPVEVKVLTSVRSDYVALTCFDNRGGLVEAESRVPSGEPKLEQVTARKPAEVAAKLDEVEDDDVAESTEAEVEVEAADVADDTAAEAPLEDEDGAPRKKRRRRGSRGGRGRRKKKGDAENAEAAGDTSDTADSQEADAASDEGNTSDDDKPKSSGRKKSSRKKRSKSTSKSASDSGGGSSSGSSSKKRSRKKRTSQSTTKQDASSATTVSRGYSNRVVGRDGG